MAKLLIELPGDAPLESVENNGFIGVLFVFSSLMAAKH
jgi:hypothetical protein